MSYLSESWLRPLVLSGVMLRNRALVLLTTFNFISQIITEQMVYTDGWIPMSNNDIYNQIRRESTEYPVYFTTKPSMEYDSTLNVVQRKIDTRKYFGDIKKSLELINKEPLDTIAKEYVTDEVTKEDAKDNSRKAKRVWDDTLNINVNNMVPIAEPKKSGTNKNNTSNEIITAATSNTYEVTEDTDKSLGTEENNVTENVGYQYNPPIDQNHNLSSTLYKILSKYNINSHDELPNYHLSLRNKVQNSMESNTYRLPLPYRYNSLNHLPVDPLLAVFLSNYGFYLPSLYGIKSNYNNLYGYLASNNIHNNKPFGLYKVFSDTDSWN